MKEIVKRKKKYSAVASHQLLNNNHDFDSASILDVVYNFDKRIFERSCNFIFTIPILMEN